MHRRCAPSSLLAGLLLFGMLTPNASAAFVVTFDAPAYAGNTATLGVNFAFSGAPADTFEAFQLSVIGSDPLLTASGSNFSRFSFALNSALLPGWAGSPANFGQNGYVFFSTFGGGLSPSATPYRVGTISIDLAGLSAATPLTVTLNGGSPLFPTAAAGLLGGAFDFIPVDASAATIGVRTSAVPEPSSLILGGLGTVFLFMFVPRRRSGLRITTVRT